MFGSVRAVPSGPERSRPSGPERSRAVPSGPERSQNDYSVCAACRMQDAGCRIGPKMDSCIGCKASGFGPDSAFCMHRRYCARAYNLAKRLTCQFGGGERAGRGARKSRHTTQANCSSIFQSRRKSKWRAECCVCLAPCGCSCHSSRARPPRLVAWCQGQLNCQGRCQGQINSLAGAKAQRLSSLSARSALSLPPSLPQNFLPFVPLGCLSHPPEVLEVDILWPRWVARISHPSRVFFLSVVLRFSRLLAPSRGCAPLLGETQSADYPSET